MIGDTIVALATPAGPGARAVLRLSGPSAFATATRCFRGERPHRLAAVEGHVEILGLRLPAMALTMVANRSFTGEDVVELQCHGGPAALAAAAHWSVMVKDLSQVFAAGPPSSS